MLNACSLPTTSRASWRCSRARSRRDRSRPRPTNTPARVDGQRLGDRHQQVGVGRPASARRSARTAPRRRCTTIRPSVNVASSISGKRPPPSVVIEVEAGEVVDRPRQGVDRIRRAARCAPYGSARERGEIPSGCTARSIQLAEESVPSRSRFRVTSSPDPSWRGQRLRWDREPVGPPAHRRLVQSDDADVWGEPCSLID